MSLEPRPEEAPLVSRSDSGGFPAPPIHALAALATIALDGVFTVPELAAFSLPITVVAVGALGFSATALVQRFVAKDDWGASLAKGLVMGIIAGVPYPVAGTLVGLPLLAWSGLHQWRKLPRSGNNQLVDDALRGQRALEEKRGGE
ncbi:MAG: hypothetical protein NZP74_11390 [Anaerolineales bacterium]|nr:hypothetical protein [Anaerolineales bacterium]MDW8276988.1 hypothetical protein [Anaerolineales bacterium]